MFVSLFYGENMKLFLALILSSFAVTAFAGEAPEHHEPQTTVSEGLRLLVV